MSEFFNIAAPGNALDAQSGLNALLNGASSANEAPQGLFSSIISALNGDNSPKLADLIQVGSPTQTGESWLNLQVGDASISLSAKALTTPLTPQSLLELAPDIIDTLNLDGMADEGLNMLGKNIEQTIQTALESQPQISPAGIQGTLLRLQEMVQSPLPELPQLANNLDAAAKTATDLHTLATNAATNAGSTISAIAEQNPQISALSKTILGQREPVIAPSQPAVSANVVATTEQLPVRENLAAQLQSQLGTAQEQAQTSQNSAQPNNNQLKSAPELTTQITTLTSTTLASTTSATAMLAPTPATRTSTTKTTSPQPATPQATTTQAASTQAAPQNPANFAAAMTQLPFVQTRQVSAGTMTDPLMVAQNFGQPTISTEQAALFQPVKAAYQAPQVNLPHMAVAIARNLSAGKNDFQIRLDPAELGRVKIHISMDDKGAVQAKMMVERPETLQLLQQDARALERALSQAGIDGARANLEFFQQDNPFADGQFDNPTDENQGDDTPDLSDEAVQNPLIANYQGSVSEGGVSLWA